MDNPKLHNGSQPTSTPGLPPDAEARVILVRSLDELSITALATQTAYVCCIFRKREKRVSSLGLHLD